MKDGIKINSRNETIEQKREYQEEKRELAQNNQKNLMARYKDNFTENTRNLRLSILR